ncbi:AlpA family phage regulatory protein [Pseudomonas asiatica]|uniref:helix-turn-helix transcriptional regulator n=1 Tax=Pseudomonas TaxID=286 RepID=UPI002552613E|nr:MULTISPECIES: AlpA family phage regulatory protein [Pseudomonas]MDM9552975.1 AlpA family phage regulatory protein [Pseudomonas asiatica]MEE1917257.1 AlpA family phage regulatory protein [Pseudomonas asiatica]WIV23052.1 AlpA family phage regulatory protein [Pseudomonas sp. M2(2023)]
MATPIPFDSLPDSAVIREPLVLALTGYSHTSLWDGVRAGTLPKPVQIGPRMVGWRVGDVRALLASFTVKTTIDGNAAKAVSGRQAKRQAAKAELI